MKKENLKITMLFMVVSTLISCVPAKSTLESPDTKIKNVNTTTDKDSNYIKANEWMVQTFNNAKSVIQFSDKEAGVVKGKYVMKVGVVSTSPYTQSTPDYYAIITIRVKDEASRIEIVPPS